MVNQRIFLTPGKNNKEERLNFVKYWAEYIKTHSDKDWSEQQKILVNSLIGDDNV